MKLFFTISLYKNNFSQIEYRRSSISGIPPLKLKIWVINFISMVTDHFFYLLAIRLYPQESRENDIIIVLLSIKICTIICNKKILLILNVHNF